MPPRVLLYCVDAGAGDTPTVFADSRELIGTLSDLGLLDTAKDFDFEYTKRGDAVYRRPLVEWDPVTGKDVMHVVNRSAPIRLVPRAGSKKLLQEAEQFYDTLSQLAARTLKRTVHHWKAGQMVVFDNARLVHGRGMSERAPDEKDRTRHLVRIWLSVG